jgi:S1-C subfamily serine protease
MQGTGWFFSNDKVVTDYHVVKGALKIQIQFSDGDINNVYLGQYNEMCDVAILNPWAQHADQDHAIIANNADQVEPNCPVFATGYPHNQFAMTTGNLTGRDVNNGHAITWESSNLFVDHGSSGEPVMDKKGVVLGMVQAGSMPGQPYKARIITMNVILDASSFLTFVRRLINTGSTAIFYFRCSHTLA